ncbi:Uncharacterised protein r2_g2867 [Pycnogonum litorale]
MGEPCFGCGVPTDMELSSWFYRNRLSTIEFNVSDPFTGIQPSAGEPVTGLSREVEREAGNNEEKNGETRLRLRPDVTQKGVTTKIRLERNGGGLNPALDGIAKSLFSIKFEIFLKKLRRRVRVRFGSPDRFRERRHNNLDLAGSTTFGGLILIEPQPDCP